MPLLKHIEFLLINMINYIVILCFFLVKHYYLVKRVLVFIHAMIDYKKNNWKLKHKFWPTMDKDQRIQTEKYKEP